MKKVFLLLIAVVGMLAASCNGTAPAEAVESAQDSTTSALELAADSACADTVVVE